MTNTDFTDPFAYQQALAQSSLQRAQQEQQYQPKQGQMVGRVYVPTNPVEHLAGALRNIMGGQQERQAIQEMQGIGQQRQEAQGRDMSAFVQALRGTPAQAAFEAAGPAPQGAPQEGGYTVEAQPARKGDPMGAYSLAASSTNPMIRQMGISGMAQLPQMEATKAEREANRAFQAEQREADRQTRKDIAQQNVDLRREVRNAGAGNKPAGQDWKYDAGSDTWVKPPSAEFPTGQTTPNAGKAASFKNFNYLANNMTGEDDKSGIISKTAQGGYFGLGGALGGGTQAAKEFDNNVEQMSTELRTVFRIPGEGALSDKEQAQYGIQLPKRGNDPELNRSIIRDLKVRMGNRVDPQGGQQSPNQPKPKAGGPKVGDAQDGFVFIGGNPADPKSWKKQ